jgi:enoyl-CoA hydratase/3-hydroxyacyl-CoA dehydrogenase
MVEWSFDDSTGIGRVKLNRPDSLNAFSSTLRKEFVEAFHEFERINDTAEHLPVRAVIVSGAGRAFSVGADVDEFAEGSDLAHPEAVYDAAGEFPGPVIAEIDGYCLGGGLVMSLDCDFRFASERSEFSLPEVDLGIPTTGGGLGKLRAEVGASHAKRLAVTGERFDARTAEEQGLVEAVYSRDELTEAVTEFAETIASKPPLAVRSMLDIVEAYGHEPPEHLERREDLRLRRSKDYQNAVEAFQED